MRARPLSILWFSYFPVEWLPGVPDWVARLPRQHPASWQRVLLEELEKTPSVRLHIIALRKQFERDLEFERNGVRFHLLKSLGGLRAPTLFYYDTWRIRQVVSRVRPDVVHAWGTENGAAIVATRLKVPHVITIQGLMRWYNETIPPTRYERIVGWLERISLQRARLATGESNFSCDYARRAYPALEVRHVDVVPDPLFHEVVRRPETQPPRILYVGALALRKGGDVLVRALDRLSGKFVFRCIVVGSGAPDFMSGLRNSTGPEVWNRIEFKQNLNPAQMAEELSKAAFMVCPTRADTGPVAVKEAVAAGVPVVGSEVGGIPDYVTPGKNGFLFPSGDFEACAGAIQDALQHSMFKYGHVDAVTLAAKREVLSAARMARQFVETYNFALRQQGLAFGRKAVREALK